MSVIRKRISNCTIIKCSVQLSLFLGLIGGVISGPVEGQSIDPIPVHANFPPSQGGPGQNIGQINIEITQTNIRATFKLNGNFGFLCDWYNFRWVNVETSYGTDLNGDCDANDPGEGFDVDMDGNFDDPLVGELPAVDPAPLGFGNGDDLKPFYWTDAELGANAWHRPFEDARSDPVGGTIITFKTYLVIENLTDHNIPAMTICVLAGFCWKSVIPAMGGPGMEVFQGPIPAPGAADVALINDGLGVVVPMDPGMNDPSFPGWTAAVGCVLSACIPQISNHTNTVIIDAGSGLACAAGGVAADNNYFQVYDLTALGTSLPFDVGGVCVGMEAIQENFDGSGTIDDMIPADVHFYFNPPAIGSFVVNGDGPVSPVPSASCTSFLDLAGANGAQLNEVAVKIPCKGVTIPSGTTTLVVHVYYPGFTGFGGMFANGDLLFHGGNTTGPAGFLAAAACGLNSPLAPGAIGFPNSNFLIVVKGVTGGPCAFALGDVDQNGVVNLLDVAPFVNRLTTGTFQCEADINGDGAVTLLDVAGFVVILTGG